MNRMEELNVMLNGLTHLARHYGFAIEGQFIIKSLGSHFDTRELTNIEFHARYNETNQEYELVE